MRKIILSIFILIVLNQFLFSQNNKLIPVDSCNYILVADTLIDQYEYFSDSNLIFQFDPERIKECPCSKDNENGIVSNKSSSFKIKENKCFFLFNESNKKKYELVKRLF